MQTRERAHCARSVFPFIKKKKKKKSLLYLKYGKVYEVEKFSIEKLRKFSFETDINANGKRNKIAEKKMIEKYSEKTI